MDPDQLANFVLEYLKDMPPHDLERFLDRIDEEYCIGVYGCKKPTSQCDCKPMHY